MSGYTYDPTTWNPILAGVVAGAIGAIVAAVLSIALESPNERYANSLSVVIISLVLGAVSGELWRRLRATSNGLRTFGWTTAGGFVAVLAAIVIADRSIAAELSPYAVPVAAVIFITLGFLTPLLDGVRAPVWLAALPVLIALGLGAGLLAI
jgi:hypothetical protein